MNRHNEWKLLEDFLKLRRLNQEIQQATFYSAQCLDSGESLAMLKIMQKLRDDLLKRVKEQLLEIR